MSRVYYTNETISKIDDKLDDFRHELVELEQTMGWNLRCAYQGNIPADKDFHQESVGALVQILEQVLKVRRLLDEISTNVDAVEAEVVKIWLEASPENQRAA
jgi:hypothetical protein